MAKSKKTARRPPKPLLAAAVFCDKVLEGMGDGAMSAIRIVDTVTVSIPHDHDPEERVPIRLNALIAFRSGDVKGERTLRLRMRMPTGKRKVVMEKSMTFLGGESGTNVRVTVELKIKTEGLYWIDVLVDRARFTSMPLRIFFVRTEANKPPAQGARMVQAEIPADKEA
jgi:hypothetical protein